MRLKTASKRAWRNELRDSPVGHARRLSDAEIRDLYSAVELARTRALGKKAYPERFVLTDKVVRTDRNWYAIRNCPV